MVYSSHVLPHSGSRFRNSYEHQGTVFQPDVSGSGRTARSTHQMLPVLGILYRNIDPCSFQNDSQGQSQAVPEFFWGIAGICDVCIRIMHKGLSCVYPFMRPGTVYSIPCEHDDQPACKQLVYQIKRARARHMRGSVQPVRGCVQYSHEQYDRRSRMAIQLQSTGDHCVLRHSSGDCSVCRIQPQKHGTPSIRVE